MNMTANDRRFQILNSLLKYRKVSIQGLSLEFHVSYMTAFRDIQFLSCYFPIITKRGTGGGVFLMDGYQLGMKYLTEPQAVLLEKISATLTGEDLILMREILKTFKKPS